MKTTIDRFGRVVVPKQLRDRFGLQPGTEVEIGAQGNDLIIKQTSQLSPLQDEEGVLVFDGNATGDIAGSIRAQREKRLQRLSSGIV